MKNVLITGATGFLGGYILDILNSDQAFKISTLSRSNKNLIKKHPDLTHYEVNQMDQIPFSEFDCVIHSAYYTSSDALPLAESLEFSRKLFGLAGSDIINLSSRSVYGQNPNIPWTEKSSIQPDTLYAYSKYCSELELNLAYRHKSFNFTNIRLSGLVGKNYEQRAVNKFVQSVIDSETINIKGGRQQFAYLHFKDAALGIIALLKTPSEKWKPIYNLGYTKNYNIVELAEIVAQKGKDFGFHNTKINLKKDNTSLYADLDSSEIYQDSGWKPKFDMGKIVKEIFEYKLNDNGQQ